MNDKMLTCTCAWQHCSFARVQIEGSVGAVMKNVRANTIDQPVQYLKMGVLAVLYTLQVRY